MIAGAYKYLAYRKKKKKMMSAPLELQGGTGIHTSNSPEREL